MSVLAYYDIDNNEYKVDITDVTNDIVTEKFILNDQIKLKVLMIVDPQIKYTDTYTITLYTDTFQINVHSYISITNYDKQEDIRPCN